MAEEPTIKYTTATIPDDNMARDHPSVPLRLDDAKQVVRELFQDEVEAVDQAPGIITLKKKVADGVESDKNLGESLPTIRREPGSVKSLHVFTPLAGSEGADRDMSELNDFVRHFRKSV